MTRKERSAANRARYADMAARHQAERAELRDRHALEFQALTERQRAERSGDTSHLRARKTTNRASESPEGSSSASAGLPPVELSHVTRCHFGSDTRRVTPQGRDSTT